MKTYKVYFMDLTVEIIKARSSNAIFKKYNRHIGYPYVTEHTVFATKEIK